jgi:hypothetical protein
LFLLYPLLSPFICFFAFFLLYLSLTSSFLFFRVYLLDDNLCKTTNISAFLGTFGNFA